ncbi:MAG: hypothetical protein P4L99_06820 [Chthoniobacter sp.]|nr:hypothetical protein [Chthoniobacter sp.]
MILDFLHAEKRILRDAFPAFQPVQERRPGRQVFVERLRRLGLPLPPRTKALGADVLDELPAAFLRHRHQLDAHALNILFVPTQPVKLSHVFFDQFEQRHLQPLANRLWREQPGLLLLQVPDDLPKLGFGDLFVRRAKGHRGGLPITGQSIAAGVVAGFDRFPLFLPTMFEDVFFHF